MKPAFGTRVRCHPNTGILLDGYEIPYFDGAVAVVRTFHSSLPGLHSIGWDIAVTPEGPVVIEGNDDWDGAVAMVLETNFSERFQAMYQCRDTKTFY